MEAKDLQKDLQKESFRHYEWIDPVTGNKMTHRIYSPVTLCLGKTTHRILDENGIVHIVPSIGYFGCVLLTESKDLREVR